MCGGSVGEDWRHPEVHALTALADGGALSLHSSAEYRRLQQPVIQMSAFVGELELHKATATIVGACVAASKLVVTEEAKRALSES